MRLIEFRIGEQVSNSIDTYLSFLLRLWRDERDGAFIWRASLESAQTREQHTFATLDELITFLRERVNISAVSKHEE